MTGVQTCALPIFYADWCAACKELAEDTFPKAAVRKALENTVWLQADVDDNKNPDGEKIMKHFGAIGLPAVIFFDLNGKEKTRQRVLGFLTEEDFVKRVEKAFH